MNEDLTYIDYEMCEKDRCWFFIDRNDAAPVIGPDIAKIHRSGFSRHRARPRRHSQRRHSHARDVADQAPGTVPEIRVTG